MNNLFIGLIFLILIAAAVYIFKILIDRAENPQKYDSKSSENTGKGRNNKTLPIQDFIDLQDIQKGILKLTPGNRYRAIIRVGSINYYLMSEPEKQGVVYSLLSLASSFSFPVQIYATTELIDTANAVKEITDKYHDLPELFQQYASYMVDYLNAQRYSRAVLVRHSYLVLPYDANVSFEDASGELLRRVMTVIDGLGKAGIKANMLSTPEVTDLLHSTLNRQDVLKASDLMNEGGFDLYVAG